MNSLTIYVATVILAVSFSVAAAGSSDSTNDISAAPPEAVQESIVTVAPAPVSNCGSSAKYRCLSR